jgi:hypothetical protein
VALGNSRASSAWSAAASSPSAIAHRPRFGGSHQRLADSLYRGWSSDFQALAAAAVVAGQHAELRGAVLVHAAGGAVAGFVQRAGDIAVRAQFALERGELALRAVFGRAQTERGAEALLQGGCAEAGGGGERLQAVVAFIEQAAGVVEAGSRAMAGMAVTAFMAQRLRAPEGARYPNLAAALSGFGGEAE